MTLRADKVRFATSEAATATLLARKDVAKGELPNIELVSGDILDPSSLTGIADGCDVVFHAAAVFAYWGIDDNDLEAVTVQGTANVLEAAAAASVPRVVLTSSSVVCGSNPGPIARDEGDVGSECGEATGRRVTDAA